MKSEVKQRPCAAPATVEHGRGTQVRSMTGYGRACLEDAQRVTAEVRAVNGRYLKLSVKLPGRYGALEERIKTLLADLGIKRGSIDISLFFEGATEEGSFGINEAAVKAYAEQARQISKKLRQNGDIPIAALLNLPGVLKRSDDAEDLEAVWKLSRKTLDLALAAFNQMREREGEAIAWDIRSQLAKLDAHRRAIGASAVEAMKASIQKFKDRIAKLLEQTTVNPPLTADALEREVVLMADRTDISEELARLESHLQQMEGALASGGEAGKKLDFLTQELFRETNTIGSKTQDDRITYRVVEMKGLIEKIREQVQNLE